MTIGEGLFHDVCADSDPAARIRSMSDASLRTLNLHLESLNQQEGIAGQIWEFAFVEAARRFVQGGRP